MCAISRALCVVDEDDDIQEWKNKKNVVVSERCMWEVSMYKHGICEYESDVS